MMDLPHPVVGLRLLMEGRIGLQLLLPWLCGMVSLLLFLVFALFFDVVVIIISIVFSHCIFIRC